MNKLISAVAIASAAAMAYAGSADEAAIREVRELEERCRQAVLAADRAFFEQILADDFIHTSHAGHVSTKPEWLAGLKPGSSIYSSYNVDDQRIGCYADTAVVTGRTTPQGTNANGEPITGQFRYLRVWVRRDGRWQAVAFQGTRVVAPGVKP